MPILKLKPACKDYLWGGDRLRTDFGVESDLHPLAEAWVLSCHPDGPSTIVGGPYDGKTLADYIQTEGKAVLGDDCAPFAEFPVLTKLIDAKNNLSIQVHPSDEYALEHEHQYGKTEMWYIVDCEPGAFLYYGFQHEITEEEFERRIQDNTLTEVLNAAPVHKGDVFFIPSGTLHAICKGIVIAEIQQSSNVTYRVYDYGRVGADGKPRALHIQQALAVTKLTPPEKLDFGKHLGQCKYFTVDLHKGDFAENADSRSFVSLLFVDGEGTVAVNDEKMQVKKGESLFIPACTGEILVTGTLTTLVTRV
ncbi:type I phosphomannose isomerase catalytic subunit [uncultured Gemmiger sp.]|uniref:type I phosphomannose isomerase catalytic subunit n=1 Tax=uncultured Gemmiger sp. TaxID=1623490 RepID=UPI0025DEADDB|nr:type I phosphomannose isomerase catalytic subunit [uncultured Gemmiger sp.]